MGPTVALLVLLVFHVLFCHVHGCHFEKTDSPGYLLTLTVVWLDCLLLLLFMVEMMSVS